MNLYLQLQDKYMALRINIPTQPVEIFQIETSQVKTSQVETEYRIDIEDKFAITEVNKPKSSKLVITAASLVIIGCIYGLLNYQGNMLLALPARLTKLSGYLPSSK